MDGTFVRALTRSLPSIGRQCQLRASSLRQARAFSSTPQTLDAELDKVLSARTNSPRTNSPRTENPLNAIKQIASHRGASPVTSDFTKMAQDIEKRMLKDPLSDTTPIHRLHVYTHKHNTLLCLTEPNGNPMISMSAGNIGFRKSKRGGFDAAYQLTSHVFALIQERGWLIGDKIQKLEVVYRGFSQGRDGFTKVLLANEGKHIRNLVFRVSDSTRIKFGGTRSQRVRRL
ncbi:translational machinery component [Aspergillus karnatakaensis]|uniref:mitochondrial 37S ribosomal protein uS11m n=1 Tax=Aspergillus karnatakaensis TaxID=1810916 RepID=UPI003CCC9D23